MAIEVELKARVHNVAAVKKAIAALGGVSEPAEYEKNDQYWYSEALQAALPSGVRVRQETRGSGSGRSALTLVTYKRKEHRDGVEVNDEQEFEVSDGAAFTGLLSRLGLTAGLEKRKTGWALRLGGGQTIELHEVPPLGWFVEIEILCAEGNDAAVSAARAKVLETLRAIGLSDACIEHKYYSELLQEAKNN